MDRADQPAKAIEPPAGLSNLELVGWAFEKFGRADPSGMVAIVTDATFAQFPDLTCHGRAEIAAWLEEEIDAIEGWSVDLHAIAAEGDDVLLRWRMTGTHAGPLENVHPTGRPVTTDGVSHFVVRGGRAESVVVVIDRMQFAISIGMMGPPGSGTDRVFKAIFNTRTKIGRAIKRAPRPQPRGAERPELAAEPPAGASNLELARWALGLLSRGDPAGMAAISTDETIASFPEATFHGAQQISARFRDQASPFDDFALEPIAVAADGEHVVARWRLTGIHSGPVDGVGPTGKPVVVDGGIHMVFRDGRLESLSMVVDQMQFALAIGMMAAAGTTTDRALKAIFNARTRLAGRAEV